MQKEIELKLLQQTRALGALTPSDAKKEKERLKNSPSEVAELARANGILRVGKGTINTLFALGARYSENRG